MTAGREEMPKIEEMSEEDTAWHNWETAQNGVDTPNCDCGHDGMGPAWHSHNCPGAAWAYAVARRFGAAFPREDQP